MLPQIGVSANQACALYLVNAIKDIFDTCLVETITAMKKSESNIKQMTDETRPEFISMVQNMIGAGIRKARLKFCDSKTKYSEDDRGHAQTLFANLAARLL